MSLGLSPFGGILCEDAWPLEESQRDGDLGGQCREDFESALPSLRAILDRCSGCQGTQLEDSEGADADWEIYRV